MNKRLTVFAAALLLCGAVSAQEAEFDLSAQRSESQSVLKVPGERIDHRGLAINPTPHAIAVDPAGRLDLSAGVVLKDPKHKFASDVDFLRLAPKGVSLTVDFGAKQAARAGVKALSGAYKLSIGKQGIAITGYDERGAFYGLQTLRQIVASPAAREGLPYVEVNDYPDLRYRGVVEGFYGNPWSHEVRLSLIDLYGRLKMNSYLYGPKDDPYHSCPNWRQPYPEREAQQLKELVEACRRNRVDFVWAIHPGQDIKWNEEDYGNLLHKFNLMYDLGVRAFAIFFDDISGEGTNPERQTELLNRLDRDFVKTKGDVASLIVCPTDYSRLWANPTPQGSLAIYGRTLDPSIEVFWTGDVVCSDLTEDTLDWVNSRIERPAFYWWNFPVTDYARHILMMGPVYGLETSLTADDLSGFVSNPMEHGEASKVALYSVADYTWNIAAYNPIDSWERAFDYLAPEVRDALRTFSIHSCDTETGYRRDESWETVTFPVDRYTDAQYAALMAEFARIERVPATLERGCANRALLDELRPWLTEFGKLGTRGRRALELIKIREAGDDAGFWAAYVDNLMSDEARAAYNAHKSGTLRLQPFYENAMDDLVRGFYRSISGQEPTAYRGIGSFKTASTTQSKLMLDNDDKTFYTSGASQKTGDWIGVDLGAVRDVREVEILQGRNSVDDVDYFDHAALECSETGREWTVLRDGLEKQYEIRWTGEPVKARYVRLRKLPSEKRSWAAVRTFAVNPVKAETLGFALEEGASAEALRAFDGNPVTSYVLDGRLAFGVPAGTERYTLLLGAVGEPVRVEQFADDGTLLAANSCVEPLSAIEVVPGAGILAIEGRVEIFEIVPAAGK